jgi:hypothetical protein
MRSPLKQWTIKEWTNENLKTMCKFYKNKHDKVLPTRNPELFARYNKTCHRRSLNKITTSTATAQATAKATACESDDDARLPIILRTKIKTHQKKKRQHTKRPKWKK